MKVRIKKYDGKTNTFPTSVKIDKHDLWSLDITLAQIIYPALKKLKKVKHGAPNVDLSDVLDQSLHPTEDEIIRYEYDGKTDENYFKRWDYVIDQMIWSFKIIKKGDLHFLTDDDFNRMQNGLRLFSKYYLSLYD